MRQLEVQFTFAGFNFPRYIPELTRSKYDKRSSRSAYYHAPTPLVAGMSHTGVSFYLNDAGGPSRWAWCDKVEGARIDHSGWYSDEYGDGEKIRGLVVRLPRGKFLAGWSMGEGMCGSVEGDIYTEETEAAYAADSIAERIAEDEREYRAAETERIEEEERRTAECEGDDTEETEGY